MKNNIRNYLIFKKYYVYNIFTSHRFFFFLSDSQVIVDKLISDLI